MTARVIQGSFWGDRSKFAASMQPRIAALPPIQAKPAARPLGPPAPAFSGRPPGPPMPAFAGRQGMVQRHGASGSFAIDPGQLGLTSGGGKPLPDAVRGKMEAALGADFFNVRVHVGPQADRIGAIAFTLGSDIYFAPGRYQPDTAHGQQLLGHELAHVVQQRAGRVRNPLGSGLAVVQDHALEAEADRLGHRAAAHRVVTSSLQPKSPGAVALPPTCFTAPATQAPPRFPSIQQHGIVQLRGGARQRAKIAKYGERKPLAGGRRARQRAEQEKELVRGLHYAEQRARTQRAERNQIEQEKIHSQRREKRRRRKEAWEEAAEQVAKENEAMKQRQLARVAKQSDAELEELAAEAKKYEEEQKNFTKRPTEDARDLSGRLPEYPNVYIHRKVRKTIPSAYYDNINFDELQNQSFTGTHGKDPTNRPQHKKLAGEAAITVVYIGRDAFITDYGIKVSGKNTYHWELSGEKDYQANSYSTNKSDYDQI